MIIKQNFSDFKVEEHIHFPGEHGAYSYYRVEKCNAPIVTVREAMAAKLGVTPSAVVFPLLKDIAPVGVRYASVRKSGPERFQGKGFVAQRVQRGPRALRPNDLHDNRFTITVRNLTTPEVDALKHVMHLLETGQMPNYYDNRRFRSLTQGGFIGKAILLGDAEKAVYLYLAEPMLADTAEMAEFKSLVGSHWGQWGYLLHQAPRPSNYRSVIIYLKDHPHDYEEAVNHIRDRRLSAYLQAYQSWLWNHILAHYLRQNTTIKAEVEIAGASFPLPDINSKIGTLQDIIFELPRLTANYQDDLAMAAEMTLKDEGLTLRDFETRLVRRACPVNEERRAGFSPTEVEVSAPIADENEPGSWSVPMSFTLSPGHYATLIMKAVGAYIKREQLKFVGG